MHNYKIIQALAAKLFIISGSIITSIIVSVHIYNKEENSKIYYKINDRFLLIK